MNAQQIASQRSSCCHPLDRPGSDGQSRVSQGVMPGMSKTADAFDRFRNQYPAKACDISRVANDDELVALDLSDGVRRWLDGSGAEKAQLR